MKTGISILNNESGSTIIFALMFLVVLTIIGISASTTSVTERQISTNLLLHNTAFYAAESGWQEAISWLSDQVNNEINNVLDRTGVLTNSNYSSDIFYNGYTKTVLYSQEFKRLNYTVTSTGTSTRAASSQITVNARKITPGGGNEY